MLSSHVATAVALSFLPFCVTQHVCTSVYEILHTCFAANARNVYEYSSRTSKYLRQLNWRKFNALSSPYASRNLFSLLSLRCLFLRAHIIPQNQNNTNSLKRISNTLQPPTKNCCDICTRFDYTRSKHKRNSQFSVPSYKRRNQINFIFPRRMLFVA